MAFVVPLRRLGIAPEVLSKAISPGFSRGEVGPRAQHKYVKREFIGFKDGKRLFRYWYADDVARERAEKAATGEEAEHYTIETIHKFYEHLAKNRVKPSEVTEETLRAILGVEEVPVEVRASFLKSYHAPFILKEREAALKKSGGYDPPRYPLQRAHRAFQMIPDAMRLALGDSLRKVVIANRSDPDIMQMYAGDDEDGKPKRRPAGFYDREKGAIFLLADGSSEFGSLDGPGAETTFIEAKGWPRFGSPFTWTEEVVWHEAAHALHDVFIKGNDDQKKVWKDWLELEQVEAVRVSDYAYGPPDNPRAGPFEDWAESIACLISHPKQLAIQCPKRYAFLREHVIPGPSIEEIKATPDEALAWWDAQPTTKAAKLLAASRRHEGGPPNYAEAFHSDKDQFYSLMVDGRSIFMRMGPADKEQEKGWVPIPETIDPETGLPVFDAATALRWKAAEGFKEIYDEHGTPLTNEQALLYLRQNDKDFSDKQPEVEGWDGKFDATDKLSYQIYIALGQSTGTFEEERARVREARSTPREKLVSNAESKLKRAVKAGAKGDETPAEYEERLAGIRDEIETLKSGKGDPAAVNRHKYAPHPLSKEDFERITPTFKFTKVAKAEVQPHVRRVWDRASKKWAAKIGKDPVTGKDAPVLTRTLYEMPNPDGTRTVIPVNSQEPFEVGQIIAVPQTITKLTKRGVKSLEQAWIKYKINADGTLTPQEKRTSYTEVDGKRKRVTSEWPTIKYTSVDAVKLARDCGTNVEKLLERNGRYAAGQITDPMLASLINPSGQRIRNEGDLAELMRKAAKERTSTWITVQGEGSDPENPTFAHVKMTFDGGGNPLLAGEYWNRQLGLSHGDQARTDALLDAEGKIQIESVREVKPRKLDFYVGGPARYRDLKTGHLIYGIISKIDEEKDEDGTPTGKRMFTVSPIKGQGHGFTKRQTISEEKAQQALSSIDVDNIRRTRRNVHPLKSHLLLYADNLRIGADGTLRGATIRVKLPSDGSISWEEVHRLPAMRMDSKGMITVDLKNVNLLRDVFGGFVMDKYVNRLLEAQQRAEKVTVERASRTDVIATTQLIAPDGGVNVNSNEGGLLKGLREFTPDGKRFKLGSHQEEFLRFAARAQGRCMAAHFMGTGKTVSAIAAIQMFKNAKKEDGTPIAGAPKKRVAVVVPLNTAAQWEAAVRYYTDRPVTLIGAPSLPNSQQAYNPDSWPSDAKGEGPEAEAAAEAARKAWLAENPRGWDPERDKDTEIVIIPWQYFQKNERDLRQHGDFDGIIVDEAHGFAKESARSKVLDSWNPNMEMMLLLTGTPITNKLDDLPRYLDLLSNGKSPLGTREEFAERFLVKSAALRANGSKSAALTDLNPNRANELGGILSAYLHVANSEDVKGKTMPAVLLDENQPAHMIGVQERVYRLAMAALNSADVEKLEQLGVLGLDEKSVFRGKDGDKARRKVNIARAFANSPGYKPPNDEKFVTWIQTDEGKVNKKTGEVEIKETKHVLELPSFKRLTAAVADGGFDGKWPNKASVRKGNIHLGEYEAFVFHIGNILGVDYEKKLAGKKVSGALLDQISKGNVNGKKWGTVENVEYGPEGAISRGWMDDGGEHHEIEIEFEGEKITIPSSLRFIRDPKRSAQGVYYHEKDWDFTTKFGTGVEEDEEDESEDEEDDSGPSEDDSAYGPTGGLIVGGVEETLEDHAMEIVAGGDGHITPKEAMKRAKAERAAVLRRREARKKKIAAGVAVEEEGGESGEKKKKGYKPLLLNGKEYDPSIQRSPFRRRERAMFDAVLTTQNAKCDEMERWIKQNTSTKTGGHEDQQFILFGNRVGSSCRTMESKLRAMGYMDVNEALGNEDRGYSNDADKARKPKTGKYFVTYFGKSANLGDRDLNSEIFRKVKDPTGRDTDTSMFVHRCLTGSVGKPPSIDEKTGKAPFVEGWSPTERTRIMQMFAGSGPKGALEAPIRVTKRIVNGEERFMYVYESSMTAGERKQIKDLEAKQIVATDLDQKKHYENLLTQVFERHLTEKPPLTQKQIDVFNRCQFMVASDAAQVGLNWGNASKLGMYDSLHSPMQEWQRITRAARMLDAAIPDAARPLFAKLDKKIRELELDGAAKRLKATGMTDAAIQAMKDRGELTHDTASRAGFMEYDGLDAAMPLVQEAWDSLDPTERNNAMQALTNSKNAASHNPIAAAEAYFANRALERIRELRPLITAELKQRGRALPPQQVAQDDGTVKEVQRILKPEEITTSDVTNEIVEKHLTDFERMLLRSRKYLVDVKRFTTSVNMPVMEKQKDPVTGKTMMVPTDEIVPEAPAKAELSQMTSGRAKMAPYEYMMDVTQKGLLPRTNYDHLAVSASSLACFSSTASPTPVKAKPPKIRAAAARPAIPPPGPPVEPAPLSEWKKKKIAAFEKYMEKREAQKAKLAAQKVKWDAAYKKKLAKKRKEAAKKAAATRAAKKGTPEKIKKGFMVPLNTFLFGASRRGEA